MNQESKRPITVEDILRLKRAERPAPEFWAAFDRELRAKQLAALVEKRPWWRTMPRAFPSFSRYHLPLGATAVLALTFFATRSYHPTAATFATATATKVAAQRETVRMAMPESVPSSTAGENPAEPEKTSISVDDATPIAAIAGITNVALATGEGSQLLAAFTADRSFAEETPSARYIAENLRAAQTAESAVARSLLGQARGFEMRGLPARPQNAEPLAQMTTPAAARSARLNSALAVSFSTGNFSRTSERVAHRLSNEGDDRLYETASRINARGDKFGLKF